MSSNEPAGVGIGLRRPHYDALLAAVDDDATLGARAPAWLEIIPENFVGRGGRQRAMLERCRERWPIVTHGVSASIGGPDPYDEDFVRDLRALVEQLDAPYFTEHLCYASLGGRTTFDLLPLPRTEEAVRHVAARARELRERVGRPLALENISYYAVMPGSTLREGEFITAVLDEADCGLMLDVNNVYVNAVNHRQDPLAALRALPLARTRQIHLAGHVRQGPRLLDHHGAPAVPEVWSLYREALRQVGPVPTLIEWDTDIPPLETVLDEVSRARAIWDEVFAGGPRPAGVPELSIETSKKSRRVGRRARGRKARRRDGASTEAS
ncbi:MAG: DUF692 domain-containing protein [Myxococcales bacterium]|nr:DUF692 domain-containing protein [Myxococcales bacterium]